MTMNGELMAAEIREQPAVWQRILDEGRSCIAEAARAIQRRRPRFVLFVARGTSDNAALYAKYLIEIRLGLPAGLVSPSTMTIYDAHPDLSDVLFVGVSQSGGSPDLVEPMTRARACGAITLAVTNAPHSPLAQAAELHLDVLAGPERAVAATKTYTAELLTLFLLIDALAEGKSGSADALPEQAHEVLELDGEVGRIAVRYRFAERLVVTSRGYNYATAREAALKLMETSYLVADAFSAADLLHGPMAMIDRGFPVIAVVPGGEASAALRPVLEQLEKLRADVLVIGQSDAARSGTIPLELPALGAEVLSPLLTILPLQQFAWHLARERGVDPDQPRGLQKVTETW
jgi:glucosamine--fructose-6-phosphate aminotransferase (isomerizing)